MKRKGIKQFILRVLLAASPLALFLALYVVLDPFGVVPSSAPRCPPTSQRASGFVTSPTVPTSTTSRRVRSLWRASVTSCVTCSTTARTSGTCCW